ncbi:hypothetical protein [Cribrihabitans neustonicus]|uniref:hypothetical protein n=1 Tax=Cribrihabitans neustonicus TaxID=1429085 RepID=UPI003B5AA856
MKRWTVTFCDAPGMARIRGCKARRAAHIAFVRASPGLQIGGPLAMRPMQDFPGAIWTITCETRADAERLIRQDPYFVPALRRYRITSLGTETRVPGLLP